MNDVVKTLEELDSLGNALSDDMNFMGKSLPECEATYLTHIPHFKSVTHTLLIQLKEEWKEGGRQGNRVLTN